MSTAPTVPTRTLTTGVEMPVLGYGVFQTSPEAPSSSPAR
ncbi:aldo/keto reductase, partial [Actinomyces sp. AC-19-1]|nr:aldo/keto reductase [Actinomyces sp. 217892]